MHWYQLHAFILERTKRGLSNQFVHTEAPCPKAQQGLLWIRIIQLLVSASRWHHGSWICFTNCIFVKNHKSTNDSTTTVARRWNKCRFGILWILENCWFIIVGNKQDHFPLPGLSSFVWCFQVRLEHTQMMTLSGAPLKGKVLVLPKNISLTVMLERPGTVEHSCLLPTLINCWNKWFLQHWALVIVHGYCSLSRIKVLPIFLLIF